MIDRNCIFHWHPKLLAAGLPVPRTEIVVTDLDLDQLLDGREPDGYLSFLDELSAAVQRIGEPPVFLRTRHTSGKHRWKETCCLESLGGLARHVFNLVEHSALCSLIGLPTDVWAVREMLPTAPAFTAFNGTPICREFRFFVRGSRVVYVRPYWPEDAIQAADSPHWRGRLKELSDLSGLEYEGLAQMAEQAGAALAEEGQTDWSVDLLETLNGWHVIDVAQAHDSWGYWPEAYQQCA